MTSETWSGGSAPRRGLPPTKRKTWTRYDTLTFCAPIADQEMPFARMNNRNFANRESLPATVSAIAVAAAGAVALIGYDFGPQSTHMALHIAAMNIAAPLTAALLVKRLPGWIERHRVLWLSAATQLAVALGLACTGRPERRRGLARLSRGSLYNALSFFVCVLERHPSPAGKQRMAGDCSIVVDRQARVPAQRPADLFAPRTLQHAGASLGRSATRRPPDDHGVSFELPHCRSAAREPAHQRARPRFSPRFIQKRMIPECAGS